jgi:hypothetical protein
MNLILMGIGLMLIGGCSYAEVLVIPPAGTGTLAITVNQGREVPISLFPGTQANIPGIGGSGTVTNPTNAPVIDQSK